MKKSLVLLICAVCFMLCSCTADTSGEIYEITGQKWYGKLNGGAEVSLEFTDNTAQLALKSGEDKITINGLYIIDNSSFVIFNEEFKQSYIFNYTVNGSKLVLDYCSHQIEIEKQVDK